MEAIYIFACFVCFLLGVITGGLIYRNNAKKIEREIAFLHAAAITEVDAIKADVKAEYDALKAKIRL